MKKSILLIAALVIWVIASAQTKSIIYFDSNKSELKQSSMDILDSIIGTLEKTSGYLITINGYCDNTGSDDRNQKLSELRAVSISNYFINKNLSSGTISFKGFSSTGPAANNSTETGKSKNRRAEISIHSLNASPAVETKDQTITQDPKQVIKEILPNHPSEQKTTNSFSSNITINDLEVGKTLVLKNLNFEGGTALLLPEAKPTLELLLKTMQENPTLEIEIGGHVCCFDDMPLSLLRAQSVYKYLLKKGIAESRMTYKGYSRNKPVFEDDRDEAKARINRRVEITVLKK